MEKQVYITEEERACQKKKDICQRIGRREKYEQIISFGR